jgi:hypothetical protein
MEALFQHVDQILKGDSFDPQWDTSEMAREFRLMTTRQKLKEHKKFRRNFYHRVNIEWFKLQKTRSYVSSISDVTED